jgi:hypothetical protein
VSVIVAGQRVRALLLRRRLQAELGRGRGRAAGVVLVGAGLALLVFVAAFGGGWYVRVKQAPELLASGATAGLSGLAAALVFSSLGHAAQAFFTAKDLWLWDSAPTGAWARFVDRLTETAVAALPAATVVGSIGLVGGALGGGLGAAGALRAVLAVVLVVPFPLALGVVLAHLGGAVLPAGRLRRASLLVLGVGVAAALVWFRRARVERLLTEEGAHELLRSAKDAGSLGPAWLPPRLLSRFVVDGDPGALLAATALLAAALVGALLAHRALYDRARKLAVDESPTGMLRGSLAARLLDVVVAGAPADVRPLLRKDLLAFVRDPGQWGQVVLLGGVGVLYVVNASALGDGLRMLGEYGLLVLIAMHTGIVGFIAGGLAARFAFPQVGLEGPAIWILDGAPLSPGRLLVAKLLAAVPVAVVFPIVLAVVGGSVVGFPPFELVWSSVLIAALAVCIAAAATFRGALHPLFDAASVSELAMGPGALSTMVLTTALAFGGACAAFIGGGAWLLRAHAGTGPAAVASLVVLAGPVVVSAVVARRAFVAGVAALDERRVDGGGPASPSSHATSTITADE